MPFNGVGFYNPPPGDFPAVTGTPILAAKFNSVINDIATALSSCIVRDGQSAIAGNLPMNGFKHLGVGIATAADQYATLGQIGSAAFPSGTRMLFQQTAAPTGWTKDTTHDDKALRVVSGEVGSGGFFTFSTIFSAGGIATDPTTLTVAQLPAHNHGGATGNQSSDHAHTGTTSLQSNDHTHGYVNPGASGGTAGFSAGVGAGGDQTGGQSAGHTHTFSTSGSTVGHTHTVSNQGGGQGHAHPLFLNLQYADVIVGVKD